MQLSVWAPLVPPMSSSTGESSYLSNLGGQTLVLGQSPMNSELYYKTSCNVALTIQKYVRAKTPKTRSLDSSNWRAVGVHSIRNWHEVTNFMVFPSSSEYLNEPWFEAKRSQMCAVTREMFCVCARCACAACVCIVQLERAIVFHRLP